MPPLRLGIAGAGIAALQALPHVEKIAEKIQLTALADIRSENMDFIAGHYDCEVARFDSVEAMCAGDPSRFRSIKARFAAPVMPGETIVTDMWKQSDTEVIVRARVKERDVEVVKNTKVTIKA